MFKNSVLIAILLLAIVQWFGIGERTYHAWWMWHKFKGYDESGHTTLSKEMVGITYALSLLLIVASLLVRQYWGLSPITKRINYIAMALLTIGVCWLTLLLASPFAMVVSR